MQISGLKTLTSEAANEYIAKLKADSLKGTELDLFQQWQLAVAQQNQTNNQLQQLQANVEGAKSQIAQLQGQIELAVSLLIKAEDDRKTKEVEAKKPKGKKEVN